MITENYLFAPPQCGEDRLSIKAPWKRHQHAFPQRRGWAYGWHRAGGGGRSKAGVMLGAEHGTPCPTCGARANTSLRCLYPCPSLLPAFRHPRLHGADSPAAFARQSGAALCVIQGSVGLQAARSGQEAAETSQAVTPHWEGVSAEPGGCMAEPQTRAGGGPVVLGLPQGNPADAAPVGNGSARLHGATWQRSGEDTARRCGESGDAHGSCW